MEIWIGVAIAGVIGFGLGALVVWWIDRQRGGGTSVANLKQEHEKFREQVTTHFVETAELINRLTDSYKDVFDHLSKGAETLVDDKSLRDRMPQVSDQEVRLKRIGTRAARASESDRPTSKPSSPASSSKTAASGPSKGGAKASGSTTPDRKASAGTSSPSGSRSGAASGPDKPRS